MASVASFADAPSAPTPESFMTGCAPESSPWLETQASPEGASEPPSPVGPSSPKPASLSIAGNLDPSAVPPHPVGEPTAKRTPSLLGRIASRRPFRRSSGRGPS